MAMEDRNKTSATKTATEVLFAQAHFRVRFVEAILLSEKTDCEMGTHVEKRV